MDELVTEVTNAAATLETVADSLEQLGQRNQAEECRRRAAEAQNALANRCAGCGGRLDYDTDFDKFDPRAPVTGDDLAYHLGCEDEFLEDVHMEA